MFIHYRTQGFVLKQEDGGEADKLFTIYTKDFGKLKILGRSIRKISSKLRSGAELFCLSEIEFIQGKINKTLTGAILIDNFENIRKDLTKLSIAFKISDVLDNLIKGEEPDKKLWQLLTEVFEKLNLFKSRSLVKPNEARDENPFLSELQNSKLKIIYYYFLWNFFSLLGYSPNFYGCRKCRKKLVLEKLYFSAESGGIICQNCFKKLKSGEDIKIETIKILRIILGKDLKSCCKLKLKKTHLESLNNISEYYLKSLK